MTKRYKFLREVKEKIKSNSGNQTWKIGKWKNHRGEVELCRAGFHCSKQIYQAFSYVGGEVLAVVECEEKSDIQDDKEVYSRMRILKAFRWTKTDSVSLAIYAAKLVIDIYEKEYPNDDRPRKAIEAAQKWLKNSLDKNAYAAARAAAYAAIYAADAAIYAAADAAARAAAYAAAGAAAGATDAVAYAADAARAADAAARKKLVSKIESWMKRRIKKLDRIQDERKL